MSHYYYIRGRNNPISLGQDAENRAMLSMNIEAMADNILSWAGDIVAILSAASLANPGTDTFIGPLADIDTSTVGDGAICTVLITGGSRSTVYQDSRLPVLSAQLTVRAKDYTVASTRANAIYSTLDGIYNLTV